MKWAFIHFLFVVPFPLTLPTCHIQNSHESSVASKSILIVALKTKSRWKVFSCMKLTEQSITMTCLSTHHGWRFCMTLLWTTHWARTRESRESWREISNRNNFTKASAASHPQQRPGSPSYLPNSFCVLSTLCMWNNSGDRVHGFGSVLFLYKRA